MTLEIPNGIKIRYQNTNCLLCSCVWVLSLYPFLKLRVGEKEGKDPEKEKDPGATGQRSLPAKSTPGQSGADRNAVFFPASVPRVGPQQVPAKCLRVCSINSQACVPPALAGPAGPMHALACVFLCA